MAGRSPSPPRDGHGDGGHGGEGRHDKADAAGKDDDVGLETSAFEALERDFQEVLAELVGDKSLERFRVEFEKLHRALRKSYESEKRLMKKCRELNSDIVSNALKVQTALRLNADDQTHISQLKKEIEKAWKMVEAANDKEVRGREMVNNLKREIDELTRLVEHGAGVSVGHETQINDLKRDKDALVQERDSLMNQLMALRHEMTELLDKVRTLETDKANLEGEVMSQRDLIGSVHAQTDREKARRQAKENALLQANQEILKLKDDIAERQKKNELIDMEVAKIKRENDAKQDTINDLRKQNQNAEERIKEQQKNLQNQQLENQKIDTEVQTLQFQKEQLEEDLQATRGDLEKAHRMKEQLAQAKLLLEDKMKAAEDDKGTLMRTLEASENQVLALRRQMDMDQRSFDKLVKEKAIMEGRNNQQTKQLQSKEDLLKANQTLKETLEREINNHKTHAQEQRRKIYELEKERERYASEASQATAKFLKASDEVKMAELTILDLQKKIVESDVKLKQQQNLYETARQERNAYSKELLEKQDELQEQKRKSSIAMNNIKQLKEEISYLRNELLKANYERKKVEKDREKTMQQKSTIDQQLKDSQLIIETQEKTISALNKKVQDSEAERLRQRKEYEAVINERDVLGTQLIRRNDELALLYEKIKIQQSALSKGEAQYHERVDELRSFKLKVLDLQRQLKNVKNTAVQVTQLKQELNQAECELTQERLKVKALSEELENPLNVHRWRKLEGSDPTTFDMIQKIQTLQKRLISKTEDAAEKDMLIKDFEERYNSLKQTLARQPGPEVMEQLRAHQMNLKEKMKQQKSMTAELNTYQAQVDEYKFQIERLTAEHNEIKKQYLDQKRREQMQRQQRMSALAASTPTGLAPADEFGNQVRYHGGGFNMTGVAPP